MRDKKMLIAIDWSHTKDLTTYDGKKVRVETLKQLLSRINKDGGESISSLKSIIKVQSPSVILEQGCPMSLIYNLTKIGIQVSLIDNKATEHYRQTNAIDKSDETDARIIYELSNNGARLQKINVDNELIQLHDVYHQYCRYQKARVSLQNMKRAHQRQYGIDRSGVRESNFTIKSRVNIHLTPDLLPYDIAIDTLMAREKTLLKRLGQIAKDLPLFEAGGESKEASQSNKTTQPPAIKGLGQRIWLGILITANPGNFKCLSSYLRYCGLTDDAIKSHRYNRHARMLYHMLAEQIMKQRDPIFRPIYDKCKTDIALKHPDYKKGHIHNAALNRTSTFLAKKIFNLKGATRCE